jgi:hypothetical protein
VDVDVVVEVVAEEIVVEEIVAEEVVAEEIVVEEIVVEEIVVVVVVVSNPNSSNSDKPKSGSVQAIQPLFLTTVYPDLYRWLSVLQEHVIEHPSRFGYRSLA